MPGPSYATFADFTQAGSIAGLSQTDAERYLLMASRRVEGALGSKYTAPYSSNIETVNMLTVLYARMLFFTRTGKIDDTKELREQIKNWVTELLGSNAPLVRTDGTTIDVNAAALPWSNRTAYQPTFTILDPEAQQVDPDLIDDTITDVW